MPDYSQKLYPPDYRNLVLNPSGRGTYSATWTATNGTVEPGSEGTPPFTGTGGASLFATTTTLTQRANAPEKALAPTISLGAHTQFEQLLSAREVEPDGTYVAGATLTAGGSGTALGQVYFISDTVFITTLATSVGPYVKTYEIASDLTITEVDTVQMDTNGFSGVGVRYFDCLTGTGLLGILFQGTPNVYKTAPFTVASDGTLTIGSQTVVGSGYYGARSSQLSATQAIRPWDQPFAQRLDLINLSDGSQVVDLYPALGALEPNLTNTYLSEISGGFPSGIMYTEDTTNNVVRKVGVASDGTLTELASATAPSTPTDSYYYFIQSRDGIGWFIVAEQASDVDATITGYRFYYDIFGTYSESLFVTNVTGEVSPCENAIVARDNGVGIWSWTCGHTEAAGFVANYTIVLPGA